MTQTAKGVHANDIRKGDTVRLQFMSGTEDVKVVEHYSLPDGLIYIEMSNSRVDVDDRVTPEQIIRKVGS